MKVRESPGGTQGPGLAALDRGPSERTQGRAEKGDCPTEFWEGEMWGLLLRQGRGDPGVAAPVPSPEFWAGGGPCPESQSGGVSFLLNPSPSRLCNCHRKWPHQGLRTWGGNSVGHSGGALGGGRHVLWGGRHHCPGLTSEVHVQAGVGADGGQSGGTEWEMGAWRRPLLSRRLPVLPPVPACPSVSVAP